MPNASLSGLPVLGNDNDRLSGGSAPFAVYNELAAATWLALLYEDIRRAAKLNPRQHSGTALRLPVPISAAFTGGSADSLTETLMEVLHRFMKSNKKIIKEIAVLKKINK